MSHFLVAIFSATSELYWIWGVFPILSPVLSEAVQLLDERCFVKTLPCFKKTLFNFYAISLPSICVNRLP